MNTNLNSTMNSYKSYLTKLAKSENTISTYIIEVEKYLSQYPKLNRDNILSYIKYLKSKYSASSFNLKLSTIKSYNEYLLSIGKAETLYIIKADYIRQQDKGNPTTVSTKDVDKFLNKVKTKICEFQSRNIAIIYLLAQSGIRRSECINIKLSDIDLDDQEMTVLGKGNVERTVLLTDVAINVIRDYLKDRSNMKHANSSYLFISNKSNQLEKSTINQLFADYSTPKCKIHPHALRHHFASTAIEQQVLDIVQLQNQLGHSSLSTTSIYTQARKDTIKKNINKLKIG